MKKNPVWQGTAANADLPSFKHLRMQGHVFVRWKSTGQWLLDTTAYDTPLKISERGHSPGLFNGLTWILCLCSINIKNWITSEWVNEWHWIENLSRELLLTGIRSAFWRLMNSFSLDAASLSCPLASRCIWAMRSLCSLSISHATRSVLQPVTPKYKRQTVSIKRSQILSMIFYRFSFKHLPNIVKSLSSSYITVYECLFGST